MEKIILMLAITELWLKITPLATSFIILWLPLESELLKDAIQETKKAVQERRNKAETKKDNTER